MGPLSVRWRNVLRILFRISITAKNGWFARHPAHSCKDILDFGDSKGDGEYWIDPEKSGNPLKVYCDMKTDGGKNKILM